MIRRLMLGLLCALAPATLLAGVGVWTTNGPGNQQNFPIVLDSYVPGTIYATTENGFARSTDSGQSWTNLDGGPPGYLLAAANGVVYSAVSTGPVTPFGLEETVYRSMDSGEHWQQFLPEGVSGLLVIDPKSSSTIYRIHTSVDVRFLPSGTSSVFRTTDGGGTWTEIDSGLHGGPVVGLVVAPGDSSTLYLASSRGSNDPFVAGAPAGFYKSADQGTTWTQLPQSFAWITTIAIDSTASTIYIVGDQGLLRSRDGGLTFTVVDAGFTAATLLVDPALPTRLFASGNFPGVLMSEDSGSTWSPINAGLNSEAALVVEDLVIDKTGSHLHATTEAPGVFDYQIVTNPGELILNTAHPFTVTLSAADPHTGATAPGVATQVNDLWGYFSTPAITGNPNNPEVFVKLLDGTAINGEFWFFYGGLTNLEYTLRVTDATTGAQKTYTKPAGSECGGSDTAAFAP